MRREVPVARNAAGGHGTAANGRHPRVGPCGPRATSAPRLFLAALVFASLALPTPLPATGTPAPTQARDRQLPAASALEAETHDLVNAHRRAEGLPPLRHDPAIAAIARRHSEAMAAGRVPFGHDGAGERERRIARSIPLEAMAENVGENDAPRRRAARMTVSGWLGSAGHRRNIEGNFDATGIGVARDRRGAWYFTQIFVKRDSGRLRRPPR